MERLLEAFGDPCLKQVKDALLPIHDPGSSVKALGALTPLTFRKQRSWTKKRK
eukprot:TRINITY_DN2672_c0_g1_i1.p4 TRINITY_DN2672_c0_g1~~TRINITY_DN2672_c0_g1_i1.p4  ORF type:complete len:53 (+),score=6.60 TRINITY_DN2672_c0_g1_i1:222-380(+)